jgi:hypothetical protein
LGEQDAKPGRLLCEKTRGFEQEEETDSGPLHETTVADILYRFVRTRETGL